MNQQPKKVVNIHDGQAQYLGRWVDKATFRTWVYNAKDEQKLAESYAEYESLIASGLWHATKPDASLKAEKKKDVICTNG